MPYHHRYKGDSLPSIEVFHMDASEFIGAALDADGNRKDDDTWMAEAVWDQAEAPEDVAFEAKGLAGWYWWTCIPGCLPDSSAFGPFVGPNAALNNAREEDA